MRIALIILPALAVASIVPTDQTGCPFSHWQPEAPSDTRGVCPMLNTLANHGYLPRNGRNISKNQTVDALHSALNLAPSFGEFLWTAAVYSNPAPNATTFSLDNLNRHDLFEHDGSLSRQDAYFGEWWRFNQTVFNWTMAYWPGEILDVKIVAAARAARQMQSMLTNPDYSLSFTGYEFSLGENSALLSILGNKTAQTVPKKWVQYLFENEQLPCSLGWKKPEEETTEDDLFHTFVAIEKATFYPLPVPDTGDNPL
ncbi:Cloroperoxidase [Xylariaceae sp. FL0255]|nr:Cloroperoxidase [Xylariaceae sp. FL0255]